MIILSTPTHSSNLREKIIQKKKTQFFEQYNLFQCEIPLSLSFPLSSSFTPIQHEYASVIVQLSRLLFTCYTHFYSEFHLRHFIRNIQQRNASLISIRLNFFSWFCFNKRQSVRRVPVSCMYTNTICH